MTGSTIQRNFAGGEIAPSLYGRADQAKYQTGLRTCRNFLVQRHGGIANRQGSQMIAEVKDSSVRTYLGKFVFNDEQAYLIEIGNLYFRFYREGAQLVVGPSPYEIVTPYLSADLDRLQFNQSGDVVTITHPSYPPMELKRTGHTAWTLTAVSTIPSISAPAGLAATEGTSGALVYAYQVTAVKTETYEESEPSISDSCSCALPSASAPNTLSWTVVADAVEYNVYLDKEGNGVFGFLGVAASNTFNDPGIEPDLSITPPVPRLLFAAIGDYPATSTHYQQRQVMAGSNNEPETARASRIGFYKNFGISSPIQDDDAVTFTIAGKKVQSIRHLIEIGRLIVMTSNGEWSIEGDETRAGSLLPTAITPKQHSHYGSSVIPPAVCGNVIIYVQDRGQTVRELRYDLEAGGFSGRELSLFSAHLIDDYRIERMDFAQIPHSIAWFIRNDGILLGLTYVPEYDVIGWHRHDTDGLYEDVCVIPEFDTEDAPYVIVNRTIGGVTKRYIERFPKRRSKDTPDNQVGANPSMWINVIFLDSYLTYNGINADAETMVFSDATGGWTLENEITVTRSVGGFVAGDVGNAIVLRDTDNSELVRVVIGTYASGTVVRGYPSKTVPAGSRGTLTTAWARAVDQFSGLDHLEGKEVGIVGDGGVLARQTVSAGSISLGRPYSVVHVGLPYNSDIETLDLDSLQSSIRDRKKLITSVSLLVETSRGIYAGQDVDHLFESKSTGISYGVNPSLTTGIVTLPISATWKESGRFVVRQSDPVPLTILGLIPNGDMGG